jgi:hypothetical protein
VDFEADNPERRGRLYHDRMRLFTALALLTVLAGLHPAWACDSGTVRDAAFEAERDVHILCVIGDTSDEAVDALFDRLDTWRRDRASELNVEVQRLNADDPDVPWQDYGMPSAPPNLPVVALIGLFPSPRRPFVIDHWEPGPGDDALTALLTSPAREAMKGEIVDSWAVLLYSPGPDSDQEKVKGVMDAVSEKWAEEQPPGVAIVTFDRNDPAEALLRVFTGIAPTDPDWVGVVFGRGKLMAPPLMGDDITEGFLNQLLGNLTAECTCLQDATSLGLDIPMTWEAGLDAMVAPLGDPGGYVEIPIEDRLEAIAQAEIPDEERGMLATAALTGGIAAAAVLGAVIAMVLKRKRGAAR